ncbi:MAG: ATPase [Candidatus Thermofonsia Clade 1 bacterium]|jgi:F0F1-type ATP synthase membrane subunit b/b'|uniref:ATPase n=1 Tax=Candidatus Thermofonsia Clade 1 bacterium TaxID=2364210 RepID=A0A2M8P3K2_9CHLR|nr:MAG: ATPase [Candidatus Thermofonsia Clade 1 bacterium]
MDIQHLVDRLEELIDEGRQVWFTKLTMIDEERALEIIDQMRISIPEEVEKANRVLNQRDRILAQANEEAARIIDLAREKAETLIQRDAITQAAQNRAANIIEQARQEAEQMRADADNYVLEVLREFENQLVKTLSIVRNGINKIVQDREAARARAAAEPAAPSKPAEPPKPPSGRVATPPAPKPAESPVEVGAESKSE